jgi:hypothetical protein
VLNFHRHWKRREGWPEDYMGNHFCRFRLI